MAIDAKEFFSANSTCPICGSIAFHKHFGSEQPTCKGCSGFFRRCVVLKKSFKCRKNEKCIVRKERNKHGCQACRFRQCLKAGMNFAAVVNLNNNMNSVDSDNLLQQLIYFRNSIFTSRFKALLNAYNGDRTLIGTSGFLKTSESYEKAFASEYEVCIDYIKLTGIFDSNKENTQFMTELSQKFVSVWMVIEVLFKNLRYLAFNQNKAYFTDDSYQLLNEDTMRRYYESYNCISYTDVVAQLAMETLGKVVKVSEKFYKMKIRDEEFATFSYFFLIKEVKRLHPEPQQFDHLLNRLFRDLKTHYETNYDDFTLRLGDLMLAINYIQEIKVITDELFSVISLNNLKRPKNANNNYLMPRVKFNDLN